MEERIPETEFRELAETTIGRLEQAFSKLADDRDIDVQVEGGVLTITFEEGEPGKFIVSPNSSTRQLWVSARVASHKFDWSREAGDFVLSRSGEPIKDVMARLTREQLADDSVTLG